MDAHVSPVSDPRQVLASVFGYEAFRPHQEAIIDHVVAGGDALVLMPTGGGKSLCYQIPALVRPGVGVVVSPLIALMEDQVAALRQAGVDAACLNSTLEPEEARAVEAAAATGGLDLLYVAPERLLNPRTLELLDAAPLALFAIDEAHCVSQWGHDFRPEYLQLSVLHQRFPGVPRVALTATADAPTRVEIAERLELGGARRFVSGFDRPNIRYRVSENTGNARERLLAFIREEHPGEAGIVYCLSRRKVDETAAWLAARGITALPYHAGMEGGARQLHQQRFLREDGVVMVATIAFGMGIDKPDVRFVAHLNLPRSLEAYYQETGRAGRDGLPADAWMVYGLQDVITLRQMQEASGADDDRKRIERHKLDAMLGFCEVTECRRQALLRYFSDPLDAPCGNCDTCLDPPDTWDATTAARKALSCVHRTGQRFGVNHQVDVLLGRDNERVRRFGHHQVSTFGIGSELDAGGWRDLFRQLIAHGLLAVDVQGHGSLRLTEACRPLLRGERTLELRRKSRPERVSRRRASAAPGAADGALWEALRALRAELARDQGVPAYVIFHDATLMEMAAARPVTLEGLGAVSGVGERKLAAYGPAFLEVLQAHGRAPAAESDTVAASVALAREGLSVAQVADRRGLRPDTVHNHLAEAIARGDIRAEEVLDLAPGELDHIRFALEQEAARLRPVYEALEGRYSYGVLRCVRAGMGLEG